MTDEDIRSLVESNRFGALRHLFLRENEIGNKGIAHITNAELATNLNWLDLGGNTRISEEGVATLSTSELFQKLEGLSLAGNWIGNELLLNLSTDNELRNLRYLNLSANGLDLDWLQEEGRFEPFVGIETLIMYNNEIGDRGASRLANHESFEQLDCLDLRNNRLSLSGVRTLISSETLQSLGSLDISKNELEPQEQQHIRTIAERYQVQVRLADDQPTFCLTPLVARSWSEIGRAFVE